MMTCSIHIQGIVQGVGFRPFIYRLARSHQLTGWVSNATSGVIVQVEGEDGQVRDFIAAITARKPVPARIDGLQVSAWHEIAANSHSDFVIKESAAAGRRTVLITPDLDVCATCLKELLEPQDRRFLYPFINCTDCGPRYTLIENLPYDRQTTTMRDFPMCSECRIEYEDPESRRFHAEATCCAACGPELSLVDNSGRAIAGDPIVFARDALHQGKIVAVKGVGGFHLAVDAANPVAVAKLRDRKKRPDKPFAVMSADLPSIGQYAEVDELVIHWLASVLKPIVLLRKKNNFSLAEGLAPGNRYIGVMLPYTPVHHLLLRDGSFLALVMTSGNLSGAPIATDNDSALDRLGGIADFFLLHNRRIIAGNDDSVLRFCGKRTIFLRRARSYAPVPVQTGGDCGVTLAVGGNMKNTFCLTRGQQAFVSQHLGDLDSLETQENFVAVLNHLQHVFDIEPDLIVHDLHPDYHSTRYAVRQHLPAIAVQHHHAHAVSCMVENDLSGPVIAITLDGSGLGTDNTIWGGEILVTRYGDFRRAACLKPLPMPGGEQAIRQPYRMAIAYLLETYGEKMAVLDLDIISRYHRELAVLGQLCDRGLNSPLTSSCGRLFDGVAALLGICHVATYEGQAALELEMIAAREAAEAYPFGITARDSLKIMDYRPMFKELVWDMQQGVESSIIAGRFHRTVAKMFAETARSISDEEGISQVVLSGGVFQNAVLTEMLSENLRRCELQVYCHKLLPPNDGGLSLGQAVAGRAIFNSIQ